MMDPKIALAMLNETLRQSAHIELIASENYVSHEILTLQGSIFTNKYAEGYPAARYYGGCNHMDTIETLAQNYLKELFDCSYANVQPHSGASANLAVFFALLKPADTILGMDLASGGHLSHGMSLNVSGKWFKAASYGLTPEGTIDYEQVRSMARDLHPKLIIAGASAYSLHIDFAKFRAIADEVGALLLADVAHYSGLIAAKAYPSPFPHAHIVTSTTHKTLRGPRGGIILTNEESLYKKINSAVFPGLQGGPLMHVIAAKAQCFYEALQPEFKTYITQVLQTAQAMSQVFMQNDIPVISGGTQSHMMLLDLRHTPFNGAAACDLLESAHITVNKNAIPNDPLPPKITSGMRIGTAAMCTRGMSVPQATDLAHAICDLLHGRKTVDQIRLFVTHFTKDMPMMI